MCIDHHQLGICSNRVPEVLSFTYEPCGHKLNFLLNVPSAVFGKSICLKWRLERLSTVMKWAPMEVRVYDYLRPDIQLARLFPIQLKGQH
jgi:hypothetical protein